MNLMLARIIIMSLVMLANMPYGYAGTFWDGNKLNELSNSDDRIAGGTATSVDFARGSQLAGIVGGVHDVFVGELFCPSNGMTIGQAIGVVKKFVRDNPNKWNLNASIIVVDALSAAFPCK